jgi:hypothetical protein
MIGGMGMGGHHPSSVDQQPVAFDFPAGDGIFTLIGRRAGVGTPVLPLKFLKIFVAYLFPSATFPRP